MAARRDGDGYVLTGEKKCRPITRDGSLVASAMEWFEEIERYFHLDPVQFNYSLLTRSQRISHENLRLRDPEWLGDAEAWFHRQAGNTHSHYGTTGK